MRRAGLVGPSQLEIGLKIEPRVDALPIIGIPHEAERNAGTQACESETGQMAAQADLVIGPAPGEGHLGPNEQVLGDGNTCLALHVEELGPSVVMCLGVNHRVAGRIPESVVTRSIAARRYSRNAHQIALPAVSGVSEYWPASAADPPVRQRVLQHLVSDSGCSLLPPLRPGSEAVRLSIA